MLIYRRFAFAYALVIGSLFAGAEPAKATTTFNDRSEFLTATGATQATTAYPDLGFAPQETLVSGTVTLARVSSLNSLYFSQWTTRLPGNTISIDGSEHLNVSFAGPIRSFGFDFVEPNNDPNRFGVFVDSTFQVRLLMNGSTVDTFTFNAPNDVAAFVGVSVVSPFNAVQIRELSPGGDQENEFFGQFYTSVTAVPEPSAWVLMICGIGMVGACLRRGRLLPGADARGRKVHLA